MFKKALSTFFIFLISSELCLNVFYFTTRFRPKQSRLNTAISKIENSDPSRSIYCIGDGFTSGFGSTVNKSYPFFLQKLLDENTKFKGLKLVNLGIEDSTTSEHLFLISKLRPKSKIILRSKLDHLLYSKNNNSKLLNSFQVVKLIRKILAYPAVPKNLLEHTYYQKVSSLVFQKQHKIIYFNYPHLDSFMNHFNLDSFHIGREMKQTQDTYSFTRLKPKYLSEHPPFLSDEGYNKEAQLLFDFMIKHEKLLKVD